MIYHMLPADYWNKQAEENPYQSETFGEEGFIHASGTPEQLLQVAQRFYKSEPVPYIIVCIDESQLDTELKWELSHADEDTFPHIYGLLNREAVVDVVPFPRQEDGSFRLPDDLPK
ncbi:DUF952 domain-containing protein [bacterium]|nr:DUF952 domain-containing protein [bacterium]